MLDKRTKQIIKFIREMQGTERIKKNTTGGYRWEKKKLNIK